MRRRTAGLVWGVLILGYGAALLGAVEKKPELAPLPPPPQLNEAEVKLGKMLFFDVRLSGDATIACSHCHIPEKVFTEGRALSAGYTVVLGFRHTPSVVNSAYKKFLFWDGRFAGSDLASVVRDSITETHFMFADGRLVVERLRQVPVYVEEFNWIYGGDPSYNNMLAAVSAYCSSLVTTNAPFDLYLKGDENAISPAAKKGLALFKGKGECIKCHHGPMLSDGNFHDMGVPENPLLFNDPLRHVSFRRFLRVLGVEGYANMRRDPGRYVVTKDVKDMGKFSTPTLREVAQTAPYMHNGMIPTLDKALKLMGPQLSKRERKLVIEFLKTLSGEPLDVSLPEFPKYQVRELGKN